MKYQVSIMGSTSRQKNVQLSYVNTDSLAHALKIAVAFKAAPEKVIEFNNVPMRIDERVTDIVLIFRDWDQAVADGLNPREIHAIPNYRGLFKYYIFTGETVTP